MSNMNPLRRALRESTLYGELPPTFRVACWLDAEAKERTGVDPCERYNWIVDKWVEGFGLPRPVRRFVPNPKAWAKLLAATVVASTIPRAEAHP